MSALASEAAATQRLYERYSSRILGFCLKRLGTREEAEDAMQTTFLNAQRGLRRGVVPEFEAAWLYKIAENVCRTRYDRARRRPESSRDIDALQDVLAAPERAEPDLIAALPDAIARMPPAQRRALLLREWQGLTYREIADDLGVTEAAVETLLYRARRSLTANLEQPKRRGRLSRVDLGSVLAFLKSLLPGGAAKIVVAAVAVTAAATTIDAEPRPVHVARARVHHAVTSLPPVARRRVHVSPRRSYAVRRRVHARRPPPRPAHRGAHVSAPLPASASPAAPETRPQSLPPAARQTAPPPPAPAPEQPSTQAAAPQPLPDVGVPSLPVSSPAPLPDVPSLPAPTAPALPVQLPTVTLPEAPALPTP